MDGKFLAQVAPQMAARCLEVHESRPIAFEDLAHLMATAMWPDRGELDNRMDYGVARVNLDGELRVAAESGKLIVRNASTLNRETFLIGAALDRTVVLPQDLKAYLRDCGGIELRLIPHGSGPMLWTIEHASAAIAEQERWHAGSRDALRARMMEASAIGELKIRDPQTDMPYRPQKVREYWDLVKPDDVNAWLQSQGAPYRWNVLTDLEAQDAFAKFDPLQPRYEDEGSKQEYTVGWWNSALKASMWWELKSIKPTEAAMLLCGLNPDDPAASGATLATEGQPDANDYKTLLRWFNDEALDGKARTLYQWLGFATKQELKHHTWIDEWIKALPPHEAKPVDAAQAPINVLTHSTKVRRRDVLTPVIEKAMAQCTNGLDVAEVWPVVQRLSTMKQAPFLGGATEEGLQYEDGDQTLYFTRRQLKDRIRRLRGKAP